MKKLISFFIVFFFSFSLSFSHDEVGRDFYNYGIFQIFFGPSDNKYKEIEKPIEPIKYNYLDEKYLEENKRFEIISAEFNGGEFVFYTDSKFDLRVSNYYVYINWALVNGYRKFNRDVVWDLVKYTIKKEYIWWYIPLWKNYFYLKNKKTLEKTNVYEFEYWDIIYLDYDNYIVCDSFIYRALLRNKYWKVIVDKKNADCWDINILEKEDGKELSSWNYVYKFYFWNEEPGKWWYVYELDFFYDNIKNDFFYNKEPVYYYVSDWSIFLGLINNKPPKIRHIDEY